MLILMIPGSEHRDPLNWGTFISVLKQKVIYSYVGIKVLLRREYAGLNFPQRPFFSDPENL